MQKVLFFIFFPMMTGFWIFLLCAGVLWGATLPLKIILKKDQDDLAHFLKKQKEQNAREEKIKNKKSTVNTNFF